MNARKEKYSPAFFFSLMLHFIVVTILIVSFDLNTTMAVLENSNKNIEVINARMVENALTVNKKITPEHAKSILNPKPIKKILPKTTLKEVNAKKNIINISDTKQKKLQQEQIAENLLADIKKQKIKQKKLKQKEIAEQFEKEMRQMTASSLQKDLIQEKNKLKNAREQQMRGEVNKYKALILQAISQNWIIPPSVNKNLYAELMIRVAPGGMVLDVQVVKTSGDAGLDNSATAAVFKSSPLPVPKETSAFETFRQFILKVKPKDILSTDSFEG